MSDENDDAVVVEQFDDEDDDEDLYNDDYRTYQINYTSRTKEIVLVLLPKELLSMGDIATPLYQVKTAKQVASKYSNVDNLLYLNLRLLAAAICIVDYQAGIEPDPNVNFQMTKKFNSNDWPQYVNKIKPKIIDYYKGPLAETNLEADLYRYVSLILPDNQQ